MSLVDKWHKSKIRKNAFVIEVKKVLRMFVLFINLIYFYFVFMFIKNKNQFYINKVTVKITEIVT